MTSGPDDNCPVIAGEKTKKINDDGGLGDVYDRRLGQQRQCRERDLADVDEDTLGDVCDD